MLKLPVVVLLLRHLAVVEGTEAYMSAVLRQSSVSHK